MKFQKETEQKLKKYRNFKLKLENYKRHLSGIPFERCLEDEIISQHGFLSFQNPDKISEAVKHFSSINIWELVAQKTGKPINDIKNELRLIVERRNKIAHEADSDPSFPNARWPIGTSDVERSIIFIEDLCSEIHTSL